MPPQNRCHQTRLVVGDGAVGHRWEHPIRQPHVGCPRKPRPRSDEVVERRQTAQPQHAQEGPTRRPIANGMAHRPRGVEVTGCSRAGIGQQHPNRAGGISPRNPRSPRQPDVSSPLVSNPVRDQRHGTRHGLTTHHGPGFTSGSPRPQAARPGSGSGCTACARRNTNPCRASASRASHPPIPRTDR